MQFFGPLCINEPTRSNTNPQVNDD